MSRHRFVVAALIAAALTCGVVIGAAISPQWSSTDEAESLDPSGVATLREVVITRSLTFTGEAEVQRSSGVPLEGVVTEIIATEGDPAANWRPVAQVNGQVISTVRLPFPLWRDLAAGVAGVDVTAVQESLVDAGFLTAADTSGVLDETTAAAIRQATGVVGDPQGGLGDQDEIVLPRGAVLDYSTEGAPISTAGLAVGDVLTPDRQFTVRAPGTSVVIEDGGALARALPADAVATLIQQGRELTDVALVVASGDDTSMLLAQTGGLLAGPVSGSVVVASSPGPVLAVPKAAVVAIAGGDPAVRVWDGSQVRVVPVEVGFQGDQLVEVSGEGLRAGVTVQLP
jgi:hypothetical protein